MLALSPIKQPKGRNQQALLRVGCHTSESFQALRSLIFGWHPFFLKKRAHTHTHTNQSTHTGFFFFFAAVQVKTHQHEADDDTGVLSEEMRLTDRLKVKPTNDFLFLFRLTLI